MELCFITRFTFALSLLICRGSCATWTELKGEYEKLYSAYSLTSNTDDDHVNTIPINDFSQPLDVSLQFEINSLGGYDAVNGALDVIGSLSMTWIDDIDNLEPVSFDSATVSEIIVDYRKLWTPVIVLINSADSVKRVGDETYKVRLNLATGQATWKPRIIIKASCSPDVTFFPFDQQICVFTFTPWYVPKTKLTLSVSSNAWKMDNYDKSGVWDIESTQSSTFISGDYYYANFTITFNREPTYFTINLVLPILSLSLLSGFVFLLPAASGERIGFSITCFLTFVVLLQTTMTYLPQASSPMSLLCYYVIIMMVFCALLILMTSLLLRVYNKPKGEDVPKWLIHVLEVIKCIKCRRFIRKKMQSSVEHSSKVPDQTNKKGAIGSHLSVREVSSVSSIVNVEPSTSQSVTNRSKTEKKVLTNATGKTTVTSGKTIEVVREIAPGLEVGEEVSAEPSSQTDDESNMDEIDWDSVGNLLDIFFLLLFIGMQCGISIVFLVPIGTRA